MELHFYTELSNEKQIEDNIICDVLVDYVSTNNALLKKCKIVRTTQLSFLSDAWYFIDQGYRIFLHVETESIEVKEHTTTKHGKEIRRGHNVLKLFLGGHFNT